MARCLSYNLLSASVIGITDLNPNMRRITLHGGDLRDLKPEHAGQWVKLYFKADGPGRAYTIRHWRPGRMEMDIDFFIHDRGAGSDWVRNVRYRDTVWLAGPRSDFKVVPDKNLVLVGDETGLPAICAILESMADRSKASVVVEIADDRSLDGMPVINDVYTMIVQGGRNSREQTNANMLSCLNSLCFQPDRTCIWAGCESTLSHQIRVYGKALGIDRKSLHVSGYWKRGAAEFVDSTSDY